MTRWTILSLSFIIVLVSLYTPQTVKAENIIKNKTFYLDENYYKNNNHLKWGNVIIDFSKFHPLGRLALAKEEMPFNPPGIGGNILSKNIKWQFLKNQPIELMEVTVQVNNKDNKSLAVYLNTSGVWQLASSRQLDQNRITFHIQSQRGQFIIVGLDDSLNKNFYELPLDKKTLKKGYTFSTPDGEVRIGFMPNLVNEPFVAKVRTLPNFYGANNLPPGLKFASKIYHIWLDSDSSLNFTRPIPVEIKFISGNDELKNIYYFDPLERKWHLSPSTTLYNNGVVRTLTYNQEFILAVVADPTIKEEGQASWFSSGLTPRNPYGAANNDYPLGTMVRVTNLETGKYFDTEIISRGPYVDFRIIDLASKAFNKIAKLSEGVINVKIEPLSMLPK